MRSEASCARCLWAALLPSRRRCNFSTIWEFRSAMATAARRRARRSRVNDFKPFRSDTVGKPLPGMEIRIVNPDADGIGEVAVRSKTVMSHYLDDPEMTAETIVDGWLMTGRSGARRRERPFAALRPQEKHDRHRRRQKYLSRGHRECLRGPAGEGVLRVRGELSVARADDGRREARAGASCSSRAQTIGGDTIANLAERNRRLANYKRVSGYLVWDADFPLTASLKVKRMELAEQIRKGAGREAVVPL